MSAAPGRSARACWRPTARPPRRSRRGHRPAASALAPAPHTPADLTDAARAWRTGLPALGRLELDVDHHPRSLTIAETRVGASDFRAPDWDLPATEPGVLVQSLRLAVARGRFDFAIVPLACVSLHGLGRRLQRGSPREAVLLAELLALGRLATEMDAGPGAEFAMPAGGGR